MKWANMHERARQIDESRPASMQCKRKRHTDAMAWSENCQCGWWAWEQIFFRLSSFFLFNLLLFNICVERKMARTKHFALTNSTEASVNSNEINVFNFRCIAKTNWKCLGKIFAAKVAIQCKAIALQIGWFKWHFQKIGRCWRSNSSSSSSRKNHNSGLCDAAIEMRVLLQCLDFRGFGSYLWIAICWHNVLKCSFIYLRYVIICTRKQL